MSRPDSFSAWRAASTSSRMDERIFLFNSGGVSPQLFKLVHLSGLLVENVDDGVDVIQHYPSAFCKALDVLPCDLELFQPEPDVVGNGLNMPARGAVANDEEIGDGGQAPQIEEKKILCFFVQGKILAGAYELKRSYFERLLADFTGDKPRRAGSERGPDPASFNAEELLQYYRVASLCQ